MALSGSFSQALSGATGFSLRVDWTATQSIMDNTSTITASVYLDANVNWPLYNNAAVDNYVSYGGTQIRFSSPAISKSGSSAWSKLLGTTTYTVAHDSDGKKSLTLTARYYIRFTRRSTGQYIEYREASSTIVLDTIPRYGIATVSNFNIGTATNATWTSAVSSYKYKIKIVCGSYNSGYSDYVTSSTSSYSYSFTVPYSAASSMASNAVTTQASIYLATYNSNGTLLKENVTTVTATLKENSTTKPTVTVTVTPVLGWNNVYIKDHSKVNVVTNATGFYKASISSYLIELEDTSSRITIGNSKNVTSGVLNVYGTKHIYVTVTDSRGFKTTASTTISIVNYSTPTLSNISSRRWNAGTASYDDSADRIKVEFTANWTSSIAGNQLVTTLKYRPKGNPSYDTVSISDGSVISNIDVDSTYELVYTVTDTVGQALGLSSSYADLVSTSFTLINFKSNGKGLAIGKASELDAVEIAMPFYLKNDAGDIVKPDFVIASGKSQGWGYRKWNSGFVEAWYADSFTTGSTDHYYSGSDLHYSDSRSITLPFAIDPNEPIGVSATCNNNGIYIGNSTISGSGWSYSYRLFRPGLALTSTSVINRFYLTATLNPDQS